MSSDICSEARCDQLALYRLSEQDNTRWVSSCSDHVEHYVFLMTRDDDSVIATVARI